MFRPSSFIPVLGLLGSLLSPGHGAGETAWFVSTPAGLPLSGAAPLRPFSEGAWEMAEELDRIGRRGEAPPLSVDLSRRQVVGSTGPLRVQVGEQTVAGESLILRGFNRRGLSLDLFGGPRAAELTGFVVQGEASSDPDDGLGLSDAQNRISGVAGRLSPVKSGEIQVNLSAAYLSGQRPGKTPGDPQQGDAWTAAAEAGLWKHLSLRGEVAGSRFAPGEDWDEREGQAFSLLARYHSVLHPEGVPPVEWQLGMESQQVDPFFYSLGNAGFGADRSRVRLFGSAMQDRISVSGSAGRERNNIDDNPHRATVERLDYLLQLQYDLRRALRLVPWLGSPRYSLILDGFRREQTDAPPSSAAPGVDEGQKGLQCRVDFSREGWQWGAGYRISALRDHAGKNDRRQNSLDLRAEARVGDRLILLPVIEYGTTSAGGDEMETAHLGLRGKAVLYPDRLRAGWDLSLSRNELLGGGWERNSVLVGDLTYTLWPPRESRPGFDLTLSGSRRDRENSGRPELERREYLLYLALTMTLPSPPG